MKLYRHYKNKPYRWVGVAKHSETLKDLVIYECLYDNPTARLWVRPQEMFFESLEVDGTNQPRFAPVPLEIRQSDKWSDEDFKSLSAWLPEVFPDWDSEKIQRKLSSASRALLLSAWVDSACVGFKWGYERDPLCFYSYLGAVHPEFRGLGIARELMEKQRSWCLKMKYKKIQTKSHNQYIEMMILNLRSGFEVVGTEESNRGLKIIMEKKL